MTLPLNGAAIPQCREFCDNSRNSYIAMITKGRSIKILYDAADSPSIIQAMADNMAGGRVPRDGVTAAMGLNPFLDQMRKRFETKAATIVVKSKEVVAIACLTIWHNALEDFSHRLIRLGCALNRKEAIARIKDKSVTFKDVEAKGVQTLENEAIEKWLGNLGNVPLGSV